MKIRKGERYMGDSMHHQYVVLNMLLHKAMDNVGCSTAITDATLSVSRELFPSETVTGTEDSLAIEDASGSNDNTNITSVTEVKDNQAVEDVIEPDVKTD
ncbi:hypothetical protein ACJIZ3_014073 [Penstemon smallii]|uniref:Uncharacterized protein n=1 Tax=Penstemon smallii TaxID=265156 RepID=A0ABD3RUD6_9LAMI